MPICELNLLCLHLYYQKNTSMENFAINGIVGKKGFYGCDFVEVVSIIVKGFVIAKSMNPQDKGKLFKVHIDNIDFV